MVMNSVNGNALFFILWLCILLKVKGSATGKVYGY